nr:heme exporter protein CcmB [Klebsiella pneumoniae]
MRALLARELRLAWRSGAEILNPLWFFLIVITLFPFGVGAAPQLLAQIAPGVVWVAALLAALLVMDRLFRDDWQDGSLEQLMLLPTPLVAVVLVKVVAHWMMSGLPLLIVSPLAALLLGMSLHDAGVLALTLLLGTPTLSFLGAVGVGLTVGLKRGGVLLSLLVLPLAVPLPEFRLEALNTPGQTLDRRTLIDGKPLLLNVWATWCPTCRAEHQFLNGLAQQGVRVVGMNYKDDRQKAMSWLQRLGNPYRLSLYDGNGMLGLDLGVYGAPETFLIDGQGIIRWRHAGDLNERVWREELQPLWDQYNRRAV